MHVAFHKMHGLGNDFVVFDARHRVEAADKPDPFDPELVGTAVLRRLADRRLGIGCDQLLVIDAPRRAQTDAYYRIYNADGGEVEQCGNGVRCIAALLFRHGEAGELVLDSAGGPVRARRAPDGQVAVQMVQPNFDPASLPFDAPGASDPYELALVDGAAEASVSVGVVSMGNPHAVVTVDDVASAPVARLGAAIGTHGRFPQGVNAGFMEIVDPAHIRLRVYERGVGETSACGTGACAAVALARNRGKVGPDVSVDLPGGRLVVSWPGPGEPLWMTGPAEHVFEGRIDL